MTPDSPCASLVEKKKDCGHALKYHNPCSKCGCAAFTPTRGALDVAGEAIRLPDGSITRELLDGGFVTPSGIVIPRGARS